MKTAILCDRFFLATERLLYQKQHTFGFYQRGTVRPACVRLRAPWLRWAECEQVDQSQNGRDGHSPFLLRYKVSFQSDIGISSVALEKSVCGDVKM